MTSEAKKFDAGKAMVSLLPSQPLIMTAKVLNFGAQKYDAHNWRKGMKYSRLYDAALRHILSAKEGEDLDKESGLPHLAHAICGLLFLLEYHCKSEKYSSFDDRFVIDKVYK